MAENQKTNRKSRIRQTVSSLVFTLVACSIVFYLFYTGGLVSSRFSIDLSFVILPFVGYYVLRLFSRLSNILIRSRVGVASSHLLNGLAFIVFSYYFFGRAVLFTQVRGMAPYTWLFSRISVATSYIILFFVGYTMVGLSSLLAQIPRWRDIYPVSKASGQLVIGYGLWRSLSVFSDTWSPSGGIGLIFFSAMSSVAIANLGAYGRKARSRLIADPSKWLERSSSGVFLLGGFIATYVIFIRPAIIAASQYWQIIEWVIVCFTAWRLFTIAKNSMEARYSVPVEEAEWTRHIQQIDNLIDDNFVDLINLQENFVEDSKQDGLMAYLKQLIENNRIGDQATANVLYPIVSYRDHGVPWFAFGPWRRRILKRNRRNRQNALGNIVKNLEGITNPVYRKMEGRQ